MSEENKDENTNNPNKKDPLQNLVDWCKDEKNCKESLSAQEKPIDIIVRYVKRRGETVGCVIAKKYDDFVQEPTVAVTGSLCRTSKDTFDKQLGVSLALKRAHSIVFEGRNCPVPNSLKDDMIYMEARAKRYFKDCTNFLHSVVQEPKKIGKVKELVFEPPSKNLIEDNHRMIAFIEEKRVKDFVNSEEFQKMKKEALNELRKTIKG